MAGGQCLSLGFGIAETKNVDAVFDNLIRNVMRNKVHFDTGILGTPLILEVLTEMGRADLAYTLMNQRDYPGFGYMIEKGATTLWETFQGYASHSHPMFGSVCEWFYQDLGGIVLILQSRDLNISLSSDSFIRSLLCQHILLVNVWKN